MVKRHRFIKMALIALPVLLILLAVVYWRTSRAAYESAKYTVVRAEGNFEIRDYANLILVETPMAGGNPGRDGSFMRLFRFIAGANKAQQKISMTTPVFVDPEPSASRMAFVLPAGFAFSETPVPTDQTVALREVEARRYAVFRFSGSISEKSQDEAYARLLEWMEKAGLEAEGAPLFAYYDPPWTPPFWRRNEVLMRIETDPKG